MGLGLQQHDTNVPSTSGLGLQNLVEKLSLDDRSQPLSLPTDVNLSMVPTPQQQAEIDEHNAQIAKQLQAQEQHDRAVQQHQQTMAVNQILLMGGHIVGPRGEIITVRKVGGIPHLTTVPADRPKTVTDEEQDEEPKSANQDEGAKVEKKSDGGAVGGVRKKTGATEG